MKKIFRDDDLPFTSLPIEPPTTLPRAGVNGQAVLCSWPEDNHIGHSSFIFDDAVADALYAASYHHQLIRQIDDEMSLRRSRGEEPAGGALVRIEAAKISVCWVSREEAERIKRKCHHAQAVDELKKAYIKILEQADLEAMFANHEDLSGVFLPCPAESYFASGPRVLIVGQETKDWRNNSCSIRNTRFINDTGVAASMRCAQEFVSYGATQSKFMQFYRKASSQLRSDAPDAAVWSNQFCISFKSGSPTKLSPEAFRTVKQVSYDLLKAQIDILRPGAIIFTTGPARDSYIKECFPDYKTEAVLEPRRLWHFKIGTIHCLRTSHPRWVRGAEFLDRAIKLAKEHA